MAKRVDLKSLHHKKKHTADLSAPTPTVFLWYPTRCLYNHCGSAVTSVSLFGVHVPGCLASGGSLHQEPGEGVPHSRLGCHAGVHGADGAKDTL